MAEIQKNIIKQGKRNGVSRMFHAKNDKETIAAWRSDLNRILHIFNVRSAAPARPPLTVHFQTELAINTNMVVSDVRHDVLTTRTVVSDVHHDITNIHTVVSDAQTIVADVRHDVANTHTVVSDTHVIVSDIYRTIVENQEGTGDKNQSVSVTLFYSSPNNTHHCPDSS